MANTYTLISSNVLSSSAASVTFSSIPATYTDLVLKVSARSDFAGTDIIKYTINSDSGSNYSWTQLLGNGSAASSTRGSNTYARGGYIDNANQTASTFGSVEIYLPNYTSTSSRPASVFSADETNATAANIGAFATLYAGTAAISSLVFSSINGGNFISGSSFYLYGIKNS